MKSKAFTIIEVMVAIFLVTVGTVGSFALIQRTIAFTSVTANRLQASYLGQEGIEIVRNIRDSNYLARTAWDDGLTGCSAGCEADYNDTVLSLGTDRFLKIDSNFYNYDSGSDTIYKRKITISPGVGVLGVTVEVSWSGQGRSYQVTAQTELHNWY